MRSCSQHSRVVGLSLESGFSALWMRCCTRAAPEPVGGACHGIDPQRPRLTGYFAHGSQDFRDGVMERRVWSGQQDSFAEERETGSAVHLSPQYRARGDCLLIVSKAVGEGAQGRQFVGADGVGPCGEAVPAEFAQHPRETMQVPTGSSQLRSSERDFAQLPFLIST